VKGITNKLIILISLLFTTGLIQDVGAQVSTINGNGRFYSKDDDSLSFIKNQLLSNAFRDVFTKEMKGLGLDTDKFWRRYEEKFQEYFDKVKIGLMAKYEVTKENAAKNINYQKAFRHQRLRMKARYGRIGRAIVQHSIKKMSRSPQVPNSRYIRIEAKVNRRELHKIYLTFTSDQMEKHYSSVYVTTDFFLIDTSWSEIGIEVETDFTDVLKNNWKDQIAKALSKKVDRVVFVDATQTNEIKKFSGLSLEAVQQVKKAVNDEAMQAETTSIENTKEISQSIAVSNDYASALWLQLKFQIKKTLDNKDAQRRDFEISGDLYLQDLGSQKIVYFKDYEAILKNYSYRDPKEMSNGIANTVYQIPMSSFKSFARSIGMAKRGLKKVTLEVSEYTNMADLLNLIKFLGNKGVTKQFNPMIKSFGPSSAKIDLEYSGNDQDMVTMLKSLGGIMIDQNSKVFFPSADNPFQVVVKRIVTEKEIESEGSASDLNNKRGGEKS